MLDAVNHQTMFIANGCGPQGLDSQCGKRQITAARVANNARSSQLRMARSCRSGSSLCSVWLASGMEVEEPFQLWRCCNSHDVCYASCGTTFKYCEKQFKNCMAWLAGHRSPCRLIRDSAGTVHSLPPAGQGLQGSDERGYADGVPGAGGRLQRHDQGVWRGLLCATCWCAKRPGTHAHAYAHTHPYASHPAGIPAHAQTRVRNG